MHDEGELTVVQIKDKLCWIADQVYVVQQALMFGDTQMINHNQKIGGAIHRILEEIEEIIG